MMLLLDWFGGSCLSSVIGYPSSWCLTIHSELKSKIRGSPPPMRPSTSSAPRGYFLVVRLLKHAVPLIPARITSRICTVCNVRGRQGERIVSWSSEIQKCSVWSHMVVREVHHIEL